MSAIDWVHQTKHQFATKKPRDAVEFSTRRLVDGLLNRFWLTVIRATRQNYLTTTVGGEQVKFICETVPDVRRARTLFGEKHIAEWLLRDVEGNEVFWDVGGFQGNYAVPAAVKGYEVLTFEPLEDNRQRLDENVGLNGYPIYDRVTIAPYALSDHEGETTMTDEGARAEVGGEGHTVQTMRGDDVDAPTPDIVKIDTEGHEIAVLDGMEEVLQGVDRIVIEVHGGTDPIDVAKRLEDAGLAVGEIGAVRPHTYVTGVR